MSLTTAFMTKNDKFGIFEDTILEEARERDYDRKLLKGGKNGRTNKHKRANS